MKKVLQALNNEKLESPPIWFMRQAGRYLPEYRKIREKLSFMEMVKRPEIAAEVTLQPIKRFDLDAAIIFSDIMIILDGLDFEVSFKSGPPEISPVIENRNQLDSLIEKYNARTMQDKLSYYTSSLKITRENLTKNKALFGFAAAPYTLASYLLEGKTSKTHAKIRALIHNDPPFFHALADYIADATIDYLKMQVSAGVNAVQLFDSWGDSIDPVTYQKEILPHNKKIIKALSDEGIPVIFFCRGASIHRENLKELYEAGLSALSIDWRLNIDFYGDLPVQGNLDPALLFTSPNVVAKHTNDILKLRANKPGFIFNLGHGIYPETPLENVESMVHTVQGFQIAISN